MNNENDTFPILLNIDFGGFSLSQEAEELYATRRKMTDPSYELKKYDSHIFDRDDPILIQIFHELKEKTNGKFANIGIEYIDNKYKNYYSIEDYDGKEDIRINYGHFEHDKLINSIKSIINNEKDNNEKIDAIKLLLK
jgi:hypothetical protein